MYPRLMLLRELLREDGAILVSIGDDELANIKHLLEESFGSENWVATFVWNTEGHTDNQAHIKVNHEYILCYAKSRERLRLYPTVDPSLPESSKLHRDVIENSITKNGPGNPTHAGVSPRLAPARGIAEAPGWGL